MQCALATAPCAVAGRLQQRRPLRSSVQPLQQRVAPCRAASREVRRSIAAAVARPRTSPTAMPFVVTHGCVHTGPITPLVAPTAG